MRYSTWRNKKKSLSADKFHYLKLLRHIAISHDNQSRAPAALLYLRSYHLLIAHFRTIRMIRGRQVASRSKENANRRIAMTQTGQYEKRKNKKKKCYVDLLGLLLLWHFFGYIFFPVASKQNEKTYLQNSKLNKASGKNNKSVCV